MLVSHIIFIIYKYMNIYIYIYIYIYIRNAINKSVITSILIVYYRI